MFYWLSDFVYLFSNTCVNGDYKLFKQPRYFCNIWKNQANITDFVQKAYYANVDFKFGNQDNELKFRKHPKVA